MMCPICGGVQLTERPHRHPMDDDRGPRTEAGRRLLAYEVMGDIASEDAMNAALGRHWEARDAILAIEAEARSEGLDALRAAAQRLVDTPKTVQYVEGTGLWEDIAAIEAALTALSQHKEPNRG